ncbi:hypothetical protein G7Y31_09005 [Corynebacterium lizhenjunii]|uniref:Polyketide cyclase n=1 Tax=Corynebacterium lizhenjunii TaxID=2709394 RepID=A0A7T0PBM8_9CORY|nr:SRPBCC family protein [Corynebacterium lizhenjunii]QPK78677.1 hypothetical protein G7Y31_09005 [Corynebacterium lizhenjunii]
MSSTSNFAAEHTIAAPLTAIYSTLCDIENTPSWNPAFTSAKATSTPGKFSIQALGLLRGTLELYQQADTVRMTITLPGLREESSWHLSSQGARTRVRHEIFQQGPLVALIGQHEASLVPGKRLSRLEQVVTTGSLA